MTKSLNYLSFNYCKSAVYVQCVNVYSRFCLQNAWTLSQRCPNIFIIIFGNVCEMTLFLYAIDQVVWCCAKKLPFLPFFGK